MTAHAYKKWVVPEDTILYSRPSLSSITDDQIASGAQVVVSSRVINGFRHILIVSHQQKRFAYILDTDYKDWLSHRYEPGQKNNHKWSAWAGPVYSFVYELPRTITTNLNASYSISAFSGSAIYYALGAEYAMSNQWSFRFGLVQRMVDISGSAVEQGTGASTAYRTTQSFIGALAGFRYRPSGWQNLRFGMRVEYSHGENVSLTTLSGPPIDTTDVQTGTYFVLSGGLNYTWQFSRRWSLVPSVRLGANASMSPVVLMLEGETDLAYTF